MELTLLLDLTRRCNQPRSQVAVRWETLGTRLPCNKNSFPPGLGPYWNFKPMWCIKFLALNVLGATLEFFLSEEKARKKERIWHVKICKTRSNIAAHAWRNNHSIDFNNARVFDKGILESWHTANTNDSMKQTTIPSCCQNNTLFF